MKNFNDLSEQRKLEIFNQASAQTGLPQAAIEKDWWVTLALHSVFSLPFSQHIVFKGGTSLSKGWMLIERFSEDIDLAINRSMFGFEGNPTKGEIRRLRKASCKFISNEFPKQLEKQLLKMGISNFEIAVRDFDASDTDPVELQLFYSSITEKSDYLRPQVLLKIGARSLMEPTQMCAVKSMVAESFPDSSFSDQPVNMPIVLPKRTFLEKAFLLHEEFQRPAEKRKLERKSRHLYDLEKLMDTEHGKEALTDIELYNSIVEHRKKFTHLSEVDYESLLPDKINFIPPDDLLKEFEKDYTTMAESMIYGEILVFSDLIERLTELRSRFRKIKLR